MSKFFAAQFAHLYRVGLEISHCICTCSSLHKFDILRGKPFLHQFTQPYCAHKCMEVSRFVCTTYEVSFTVTLSCPVFLRGRLQKKLRRRISLVARNVFALFFLRPIRCGAHTCLKVCACTLAANLGLLSIFRLLLPQVTWFLSLCHICPRLIAMPQA